MKFNSIPKKVLDIELGETFNCSYTLRDELKKYNQDILVHRYNLRNNDIEWFHAWTKDYALVLIYTIFNDRIILGLDRNPPKELEKKNDRSKRKNLQKL